jgi:hypothetical protein
MTKVGSTLELKRGAFKLERGEHYGTPKEVWGFRTPRLTGSALSRARKFLVANRALFQFAEGFERADPEPRIITSLGATHVIMQQTHEDLRIHRAYVTVHLTREGRVYAAKNRAVPERLLPALPKKSISRAAAIARARRSLRSKERRAAVRSTELLWFPREDQLVLAWKIRLQRRAPREDWIIYVAAQDATLLNRWDNLSEASGRARVFDPSPVTALGDHRLLLTRERRPRKPPPVAYKAIVLEDLDGSGTLSGRRVTTEPTKNRIRRKNCVFELEAHERGFEEVMVYHHIDSTLRYLEQLGFEGERAIFKEPVRVNARGTRQDNSWYSPIDRVLTFGTGAIDDAEDGEMILHELGHAIQDAICPDFGQSDQAAAMGEGFGDYLAASVFETRKPDRYKDSVMSWDGLLYGLSEGAEPPCLRRVDHTTTFSTYDAGADPHDTGPFWAAVLWDVRRALGQEPADRVIIESHFQLDAFTTFARGARAILDADRNLEGGKHVKALETIFKKRKITPL